MLLVHTSDTHGCFPNLPEGDIVIHSGDMLPNRTRGIRPVEETYQLDWVARNAQTFKDWIGDRPFLYVAGNHDFIDPVPILRQAGIDATNIGGILHVHEGVGFMGFPYVPYFGGEWNFEVGATEMAERFDPVVQTMQTGEVDVLVCHAPIYGVLDRNAEGERCGSTVIRNRLIHSEGIVLPKLYLHGHIHERGGAFQAWHGMTVFNSATTVKVIPLQKV